MVKIRMSRLGRKNRAFFRIYVFDGQTRRDGRAIEQIGWYDPLVKEEAKQFKVNVERARHWLSVGAQPTHRVSILLKKSGVYKKDTASAATPAKA